MKKKKKKKKTKGFAFESLEAPFFESRTREQSLFA